MKKYLPILGFILLAVLIIVISPMFRINDSQPDYFMQEFEDAKVIEVIGEEVQEDEAFNGLYLGTQVVRIKVLTGEFKGKIFEINNPLSRNHNVYVKKGNTVVVSVDKIA